MPREPHSLVGILSNYQYVAWAAPECQHWTFVAPLKDCDCVSMIIDNAITYCIRHAESQ